jgi:DNA repair protein RadD
MRVEYKVGWQQYVSEWICVEHGGYAGTKAAAWWNQRCNLPMPNSAEEAVRLAHAGALCETKRITVREITGQQYPRVVAYELGPKSEYQESEWGEIDDAPADEYSALCVMDDEEVPF